MTDLVVCVTSVEQYFVDLRVYYDIAGTVIVDFCLFVIQADLEKRRYFMPM